MRGTETLPHPFRIGWKKKILPWGACDGKASGGAVWWTFGDQRRISGRRKTSVLEKKGFQKQFSTLSTFFLLSLFYVLSSRSQYVKRKVTG